MTVKFLEAAREDLREAARYYNAQRPGLGTELRTEVRAAVSVSEHSHALGSL